MLNSNLYRKNTLIECKQSSGDSFIKYSNRMSTWLNISFQAEQEQGWGVSNGDNSSSEEIYLNWINLLLSEQDRDCECINRVGLTIHNSHIKVCDHDVDDTIERAALQIYCVQRAQ